MISEVELEQLRGESAQTFNTEATVLRRTETRDSQGGTKITFPVAGTYPCIFARFPIRSLERESTLFVQSVVVWTFLFRNGVVILTTDRLQVGTRLFEIVDGSLGSEDLGRKVTAMEIT